MGEGKAAQYSPICRYHALSSRSMRTNEYVTRQRQIHTTHNQTCRKKIWKRIYYTCRQGIICCLKMNGLLYISNVAQAMVGQTEGGYSRRNDLVITKLHLDKDIHSHFLFLFLHYQGVFHNRGWWKKMKNTPPFDDKGLY